VKKLLLIIFFTISGITLFAATVEHVKTFSASMNKVIDAVVITPVYYPGEQPCPDFQLHYFYGENENTIRTQVCCTLIAQLLMTVIQKIAKTKKAFSVVASVVRIHLISMLDMVELFRSKKRAYKLHAGEPPGQLQIKWI
jgi:hypothetical protein